LRVVEPSAPSRALASEAAMSRHFPAYDFDCDDDVNPEPEFLPSPPASAPGKTVERGSRGRHFPAYDWDCDDDGDPEPESRPSPLRTAHRKIHEPPIDGERDAAKSTVECPFRDEWPTLEACLGCPHFRGFSLDPTGDDAFVSCRRVEEIACPLPTRAREGTFVAS
jgi:hypothetical protein